MLNVKKYCILQAFYKDCHNVVTDSLHYDKMTS